MTLAGVLDAVSGELRLQCVSPRSNPGGSWRVIRENMSGRPGIVSLSVSLACQLLASPGGFLLGMPLNHAVFTVATVILLPASVLAGVMGMNFRLGLFDLTWMFWVMIGAMLGIAVLVLSIARNRHWF